MINYTSKLHLYFFTNYQHQPQHANNETIDSTSRVSCTHGDTQPLGKNVHEISQSERICKHTHEQCHNHYRVKSGASKVPGDP